MFTKIPKSSPHFLGRAKELRTNQTQSEKMLWQKLRAKRFHGIKFRRQVPIGPYIVDFLCFESNVIIEIDGESHYTEKAREWDAKRDIYLRSKGFHVLRLTNQAVRESMEYVLEVIRDVTKSKASP